jgi:hypothetical protein
MIGCHRCRGECQDSDYAVAVGDTDSPVEDHFSSKSRITIVGVFMKNALRLNWTRM